MNSVISFTCRKSYWFARVYDLHMFRFGCNQNEQESKPVYRETLGQKAARRSAFNGREHVQLLDDWEHDSGELASEVPECAFCWNV